MNFFKSVFSEDPDPPKPESPTSESQSSDRARIDPPGPSSASAWSFGDLIQTLATKSESVIETYRRDLQEFGSGLKKEIEVAQDSLGTVGNAIDEIGSSVIKGTVQIISQGREAIVADGHESDSSDTNPNSRLFGLGSKPYSRFEAQVRAFQGDPGTYCDEPEDSDDYVKWKLGFVLEETNGEIEGLVEENGAIESIYKRVVPESVDHETFWCRYFYKVHKLKQAEDLRANLVKRAISREEDEDLSWDVDDEEENEEANVALNSKNSEENVPKEENVSTNGDEEKKKATKSEGNDGEEESETGPRSDDKVATVSEGKNEPGEPGKDSDNAKVIPSKTSVTEEEDLGWDEIEDLSSIDDKKVSEHSEISSPKRAELRKRLSTAEEEDEDLSWDIEDDDDGDRPTKA